MRVRGRAPMVDLTAGVVPAQTGEVDVRESRDGVVQQPGLVQRAHLEEAHEQDPLTGAPVTDLVLDPQDLADVSERLGWEAHDQLLVELTERLQHRLCGAGVTTHLDLDQLGIRCVGLACDRTVTAEVARALVQPLRVGDRLVEVRAS